VAAARISLGIASRIERANKRAGTEFLVSEAVLRAVQRQVRVGKTISVRLPGKSGKHALHEVVGIRTPRRKRGSLIRVPKTQSAFHSLAQRNAFRRRDARQQPRLFAPPNQELIHSPNSNRLC
jgi:hypothetical protein